MTNRQLIWIGLAMTVVGFAYILFFDEDGISVAGDGLTPGVFPTAGAANTATTPKVIPPAKVPAKDVVPSTWDPALGVPGWSVDKGFTGASYGG